ncbi:MAG: acyl carrier protein phosphodiesterase [Bacteroidia bacterium]
MNFLAHIFLSGPLSERTVGNFIADSVKGNEISHFSQGIQEGIRLHRFIDTYTDSHEVSLKTKERLREGYGKYAPVIMDIFYDHFLAVQWNEFSEVDLKTYSDRTYKFLKKHYAVFPMRSQQFYDYMIKYDILFNYSKIEGIDRVMQGMSRRARFDSGMETSATELVRAYEDYRKEFLAFFPQLQKEVLIRTVNY